MLKNRKITKEIIIGNKKIGGTNPILIQSMTNTDTANISATVSQIKALENEGCEIVRVSCKDKASAEAITEIKKDINIPLVADIHFDYKLAIEAIKNGADKLRLNPGNIGEKWKVQEVVKLAKEKNVPIRIGVNSGSLEKDLVEKYKGVTSQGIVESALRHVAILEELDFYEIVISLKASNVPFCIESYLNIAEKTNYPLHLGITEAGTAYSGAIKSSVGLGAILAQGIGDTIRVSLTANPVEEISCAKEILKALNLRKFGIEFISCPTCGRTEIDLIKLATKVEEKCKGIDKDITVAIMGCVVNGVGEGKEADIGIAGGKGCGLIFRKGEIIAKVSESEMLDRLMEEIIKF